MCTNCPAGQFNDAPSISFNCKRCSAGRYGDQVAQASCKGCPTGSFTHQESRWSASQCAACPMGRYGDQEGASACKACGTGRYGDQTARTSSAQCKACGTGRYADQEGASGASEGEELASGSTYTTNGAYAHASCNDPAHFSIAHSGGGACLTQYNDGWIVEDLGAEHTVVAISTSGRDGVNQWVKTFTVDVSTDQLTWVPANCAVGGRTCTGNSDYSTIVMNQLASPVQARYVRINVESYNSYASLRMGVTVLRVACKACVSGKYSDTEGVGHEYQCKHCGAGRYGDQTAL
eukprot:g2077.t1